MILMLAQILRELNVAATLKINSLGDEECMPAYKTKLVNFLQECKDRLCEDCQRRIDTNPIRVLDCKNESCQKILAAAPLITENLNDACAAEFTQLQRILTQNGQKFEIDPKLVRGLDYYCKTAFEFVSSELGAQSAVGGGGRYDRLVEVLGGSKTAGVGFALGIERIAEILKTREAPQEREGIYIGALDEAFVSTTFSFALKLRKLCKTQISYEPKSLAKHLKAADAAEAKFCLCIGQDEFDRAEVWCKNLEDQSTFAIKFKEVEAFFKDRV